VYARPAETGLTRVALGGRAGSGGTVGTVRTPIMITNTCYNNMRNIPLNSWRASVEPDDTTRREDGGTKVCAVIIIGEDEEGVGVDTRDDTCL